MINYYSITLLWFFVAIFFVSITFLNCDDKNLIVPDNVIIQDSSNISFPEFFLEKGTDIDSSYISFRGTHRNKDTLVIQGTSWWIIETGFRMIRFNFNNSILYQFSGVCGTTGSETWEKVTLEEYITASEADTLLKLSFTSHWDSLTIVKTISQ